MAVELVRTYIWLEFAEALRPWLEVRGLFRVASGDETAELKGETTYFDNEDKRQRIGFQMRGFSFEQEGPKTIESVVQGALLAFAELNDVSTFPAIERVRINSIYIKPFETSYREVCRILQRTYFEDSALIERATDFSVTIEQDEGHLIKSIQIEPMGPQQLQETFLRWERDPIPEQFLFMGIGFQWNVEMEYSSEGLGSVLADARLWQESAIQLVQSDINRSEGD
jgi:hypothetical protein